MGKTENMHKQMGNVSIEMEILLKNQQEIEEILVKHTHRE